MSRKSFWCFPLFLASVLVDKRSCARRAYTRKTWSRATCIHTSAGKGGITWQATRPNSVPLAQMPDWRSVCVPCFVVLILSHITQYVKNFFQDFFGVPFGFPMSSWHDVLYQTCCEMSIVFSKNFSTIFFSVAYMERACTRTGTIYTRKKKFLVWACKTYTMCDNR